MTLSPPLAVGFAVAGGTPVDAGTWATVDLEAFVEQRSRGIVVATEPVESNGTSLEMARIAREMIVAELRALNDLPPDEAIGRAFAAANGMLFDESQSSPTGGYDRKVMVGATAVLLDGHRCTIGHVPPGQIMLIEDGLAYTVPDLASWLPDYAIPDDLPNPPEPLGYTSWTAPILAQTELSDGDVVMICTSSLAESMAIDLHETGMRVQDLAGYHGRAPDRTLDIFRGLLISERIEDGAAIVMGFPPRPGSFGVVSLDDVRWRLRERRRRIRAQARSLLPHRVRSMAQSVPALSTPASAQGQHEPDEVDEPATEAGGVGESAAVEPDEPTPSLLTRVRSHIGRRDPSETWSSPTQAKQFGIPQAHGVQLHRTVSTDRGESSWRNTFPRLPIGGAALALLVLLVAALVAFSVWSLAPNFGDESTDYSGVFSEVDQYILAAEDSTDPEDTRQALNLAQTALDSAEEDGAPPEEIAPRQAAITDARDEIDNVVRVNDLTRVGTLPEELRGGDTRAQLTGSGLFLVNGGLYQIRTDERQVIPILEQGEVTGDVEVGDLFGVALDDTGLHVTDGAHVFTLQPDSSWSPVQLGEINELGRWDPGPIGAFLGSMYLLEPDYRNIYQFDTESEGVAEPRDWVLPSVRPDLVRAVDLAIESSIFVLLDNSQSNDEVLAYRQGDLTDRYQLPYVEDATSKSLLIGGGTGLLYVAVQDGDEGWIVAFDPRSEEAWQLRLPPSFTVDNADVAEPFEELQDVALDEETGTLYIVNDDAVWTASYQLPVETTGTPTPEANEGDSG